VRSVCRLPRVKIGLFMFVGLLRLVRRHAICYSAFKHGAVRPRASANEFIYIIAAVIGRLLADRAAYGNRDRPPRSARSSSAWCNRASCMPAWNPDWFKFFMGR